MIEDDLSAKQDCKRNDKKKARFALCMGNY